MYVESTEIENIPLNRRGWSACSQHLLSIGKFDNWRQRGRSALFISLSALDRSLLGSGSRSLTKIYSHKLCVTHGSYALAGEPMGLATSMGNAKILCAFRKAKNITEPVNSRKNVVILFTAVLSNFIIVLYIFFYMQHFIFNLNSFTILPLPRKSLCIFIYETIYELTYLFYIKHMLIITVNSRIFSNINLCMNI